MQCLVFLEGYLANLITFEIAVFPFKYNTKNLSSVFYNYFTDTNCDHH